MKGLGDWLDELCVRSHEPDAWIIEIILQASTLLLLIIKLFICEFICKSDMCGALVLFLFLRRIAWWVVLGSKPRVLI
jgi:hypothetical protein